ncbi:sec-independent protein translocase protein TatC [Gracilibacillus halophilus YIM-C55.5]|uniref:Sec-independent protein translocase protein TatC n=1 Tax=Gracilibacillus halophilus YIM-C55.5 TaxID=1308866 RepID=N4WDE8_9BACI|nr:twin-arginine translocase subunit TatC [Gracilibacillus halophilus]ENH97294.1 sec-independent protein translocase protein TatC [Gracilibacillus halophilus YIM-C55.5]
MTEDKQLQDQKEMGYLDHFSELRKRLVWTALIFVGFFGLGIYFVEDIRDFFLRDTDLTLHLIAPEEIIWIIIMIAFIVALAGTLPFLCLQIWLFVRPGLTAHEKRVSLAYIPAVFLLFLGGLIFGYFIFIQLILPFVLSLNDGMFETMITVQNYFRFMFRVTLPFAVFFEVPIISMFLTSLGVVTPFFLHKMRKYAYFILIIIGTMISPPDFILQIVVAIPLIVLYEISIILSRIVYRKKQAKQQATLEE